MIEVLLAALAVYGVATLVVEYDGPFMVFARLRARLGKIFNCSVCLLPWLTLVLAFIVGLTFLESIAVVGLAMILARNV